MDNPFAQGYGCGSKIESSYNWRKPVVSPPSIRGTGTTGVTARSVASVPIIVSGTSPTRQGSRSYVTHCKIVRTMSLSATDGHLLYFASAGGTSSYPSTAGSLFSSAYFRLSSRRRRDSRLSRRKTRMRCLMISIGSAAHAVVLS